MRIAEGLEQGTPEWIEWRQDHAQASDAAIIMNVAPEYWEIRSWAQLAAQRVGLQAETKEKSKEFYAHGHERETIARQRYIESYFEGETPPDDAFLPVCIETDDGRYGASLDGYNGNGDPGWAEIKGTTHKNSKLVDAVKKETVPLYIWWQMVHQAYVFTQGQAWTAEDTAVLLVLGIDDKLHEVYVAIQDLLADWPKLEAEWERFLSGAPQFPPVHQKKWAAAAKEYIGALAEEKAAAARMKNAKDRIHELAADRTKVEASGITFTATSKKGSVAWATLIKTLVTDKLITQSDIDDRAEAHRGDRTTTKTIKVAKKG